MRPGEGQGGVGGGAEDARPGPCGPRPAGGGIRPRPADGPGTAPEFDKSARGRNADISGDRPIRCAGHLDARGAERVSEPPTTNPLPVEAAMVIVPPAWVTLPLTE